jgi:hypothetical protein
MAQIPPCLSSFIREWLNENGRDLDYRLPDGSTVPFDDVDLDEILAGIVISGRVLAVGHASARGQANGVGKGRRQPGPKGEARNRVLAEIEEGIALGEFTLEELRRPGGRDWLEVRFRACHHTIRWALEQLAGED